MISTSRTLLACGLLAAIIATGCDSLPSPPRTADGQRVTRLDLSQADPAECAAAVELTEARQSYRYRLNVLADYYEQVGDLGKLRWARTEAGALSEAWTFDFGGLGDIAQPGGEPVAGADERLLAERVHGTRRQYEQALSAMIDLYERQDRQFKAALLTNVRERFRPIYKYGYFQDAEVPPADLKPTKHDPQAEALFQRAYDLYEEGKILPAVTDYNKEARAVELFKQLVWNHPDSTRIAESAFYIGEIYKEYFKQNQRAVWWYERAWQWDPNIAKPARYQAAIVYDYRLENDAKAVELYRQAAQYERFEGWRVESAQRRVRELTGQE
jgi:hypothetical protein